MFWFVILFVAALILLEVSLHFLLKMVPGINPVEFPDVEQELVDKFQTFDRTLGWVHQPNTTRIDNKGQTSTNYSINGLGGRTNPNIAEGDFRISTYGDSFCFCREVEDDETWQYFLSKELDVSVSNYGQGNYGLDQGFMRLQQQYQKEPTDIVVMAVIPCSVMRVLSVWKHYSEFGNVLAVKPRFTMKDGKLSIIENIIQQKSDFLDLRKYADFFRSQDEHYIDYFQTHTIRFPYFLNLIKNRLVAQKLISAIVLGLLQYVPIPQAINYLHLQRFEFEQQYIKYLFEQKSEVMVGILEAFVTMAKREKFVPVFFMMLGYEDIQFVRKNGHYYKPFLDQLNRKFPDLHIIDLYKHISAETEKGTDPASLFTKSRFGWPGHYTPHMNKFTAQVLQRELDVTFQEQS